MMSSRVLSLLNDKVLILCWESVCDHLCVLITVSVTPVVVEAQQPEAHNKDNAENRISDAQEISGSGYLLLVFLTLSFFDWSFYPCIKCKQWKFKLLHKYLWNFHLDISAESNLSLPLPGSTHADLVSKSSSSSSSFSSGCSLMVSTYVCTMISTKGFIRLKINQISIIFT